MSQVIRGQSTFLLLQDARTTRPVRCWRLAGCSIGLALGLAACSPSLTVEQQVIAVIRDMEARVEAAERRPFMSHFADDFTAQDGRMNRDQFNALVLYYLRRFERLTAQLFPIQVTAEGEDRASARFHVLVTGGAGLLPERGQLYQVETQWRRENGDWLLAAAKWEPVDIENVLE